MSKKLSNRYAPRINFVPRHLVSPIAKISPSPEETHQYSTPNIINTISREDPVEWSPSKLNMTEQSTKPTPNLTDNKVENSPNPDNEKVAQSSKQEKSLMKRSQKWWQELTPKQKKWFMIGMISLIAVLVCAVAIIPPVLLLVVFKKTSETASSSSSSISECAVSTCIGKETTRSTANIIVYPFDSNYNDLSGLRGGIGYGSTAPGFDSAYIGSACLRLTSAASLQYIQIPEIDFSQKSFTIETWLLYSGPANNESAIFSQCDINNVCLLVAVRDRRIFVSFDSMNGASRTLTGGYIASGSYWFHLALVYDATSYQLRIYINGVVDAISISTFSSYQGLTTGSTTTIGKGQSSDYGFTYYLGRIDHFTITPGTARSDCEISHDASLIGYFRFDSSAIIQDSSMSFANSAGASYSILSQGRVSQAIYFGSTSSYFQSEIFASQLNGLTYFTFAFWVKPVSAANGGSLIHISASQNGNGSNCFDLLALSSTGNVVVQLLNGWSLSTELLGPVIPDNTWTHIALMYTYSNGLRLYVNGELSVASTTAPMSIYGVGDPQYVTLANNSPQGLSSSISCRNTSVPFIAGPFVGAFDDFRYYNRELTAQELCVLQKL